MKQSRIGPQPSGIRRLAPAWWPVLVCLALPGCKIENDGSGAPDRPHNYTAEQHWNLFSSYGHAPYEGGAGSVASDVEYWCRQYLGEEFKALKVSLPTDTTASADPPDFEYPTCLYFYLDPTIAHDRCGTGDLTHLSYYARHMRTIFGLGDSTDRVVFLVHPTLDLTNRFTNGSTVAVAASAYEFAYELTGAFVFRDRIDANIQYWGYTSWGGTPDQQYNYRVAFGRLTGQVLIHEFGHLCYGLGHANFDSSAYAGNVTHNMYGPRCIMQEDQQLADIQTGYFGRWQLHFCQPNNISNNCCTKRIRDRYGL